MEGLGVAAQAVPPLQPSDRPAPHAQGKRPTLEIPEETAVVPSN